MTGISIETLWLIIGIGGMVMLLFVMPLYRTRQQLRKARAYLIEAKRETEEIVQLPLNTPYPLIQLTSNGHVVFANPTALKAFPDIRDHGLRHEALVNLDHLFSRSDHVIGHPEIHEIKYKNVIYRQTITPAHVSGHDVLIVYFYDVTPLIEAQEQLDQSRRVADAANQAKGNFLANMSHELRTPMNGIIGLSDLLQETITDYEPKKLASAIHQSAQNLLVLLNDILDFSKIEAGEVRLENIAFDMQVIINQIMVLQSPVAAQKNLTIKSTIDPKIPNLLIGDPTRIHQILMNLINNALKFTHQGGITLHLSGQLRGNVFETKIAVEDTGIGIPKEKQADVFAKFSQADVSTTRKYGGTGLGLSITRDLINLMRGHIELQSIEGVGSTFIVHLPLKIADSDAKASPSLMPKPEEMQSYTIRPDARVLVVDDHPVNLLFMRTALQKIGVTNFDESTSGEGAIAACRAHTYDLIFMDCQMPDMDGLEATRQIRNLPSAPGKIPIIIALTADAMKGVAEKCIAAGMSDYLSKPIDRIRLAEVVNRYVGLAHSMNKADTTVIEKKDQRSPSMIFDPTRLDEFSAGDTAFQQQLIGVFITSAKGDLNQMAAYDRVNDHEKWTAMAHKIYGAAINIGAMSLASICDVAQVLPPEKASERSRLQQQMIDEYRRVRSYLTTQKAA